MVFKVRDGKKWIKVGVGRLVLRGLGNGRSWWRGLDGGRGLGVR